MYDRKEAERERDDLGWPSCDTFAKWGSKQCGTCKHRGKVRSPLNLTAPVVAAPPPDTGADIEQLKQQAPPIAPLPPEKRKPLKGGTYSPDEALELINSHYLIGKSDQEVAIFRIKDDGLLVFTPAEQFKLDVANIFVRTAPQSVKPVEKFWKESPHRHQRKIVFKPGGTLS